MQRVAGMFPATCPTCQKLFRVYYCRLKTHNYCSKKCADAGLRKGRQITCIICGAHRYFRPSYLSRMSGKLCSYRCWTKINHGKTAAAWKGGRILRSSGYWNVRIGKRYVMEHRLVMEQLLGRKLRKNEVVHHRDHNRLNNHTSNLQLMTKSSHMRYHARTRHIMATG